MSFKQVACTELVRRDVIKLSMFHRIWIVVVEVGLETTSW